MPVLDPLNLRSKYHSPAQWLQVREIDREHSQILICPDTHKEGRITLLLVIPIQVYINQDLQRAPGQTQKVPSQGTSTHNDDKCYCLQQSSSDACTYTCMLSCSLSLFTSVQCPADLSVSRDVFWSCENHTQSFSSHPCRPPAPVHVDLVVEK